MRIAICTAYGKRNYKQAKCLMTNYIAQARAFQRGLGYSNQKNRRELSEVCDNVVGMNRRIRHERNNSSPLG